MKKLFMLITAICIFTLSGFAQMNIWSGNKLIYSVAESNVDSVTFGERPQVEEFTFELSVTEITAVDAHITVTPSDEEKTFIWLCQPTSAYEGMDGQQIAENYTETFKDMLNQNMGLYSGNQDYPNYSLLPETEYFLIAFGYDQGINSQVFETRFKTPAGSDPTTFECEIQFPDIQAERASFLVKPNDNTIYYYCGAFAKAEYTKQAAIDYVQAAIDEYYSMQTSYNPNYPIEQVVENVCYHGEGYGDLSPLYGGTEYTFFAVPVNTKGKAVDNVLTKDFTTIETQYSDAEVTAEFLGAFDFQELKDAGHFTTSEYDENTIVMVFKLKANEHTNLVKYKLWYGSTSETDSDLIGWIEPYWDGQRTKEQLQNDYLVYITNLYDNPVTFLALPFDENNITSKMSRTYVDAISKGGTGTVAEFEEILKMLPSSAPAKAPKLDSSKE